MQEYCWQAGERARAMYIPNNPAIKIRGMKLNAIAFLVPDLVCVIAVCEKCKGTA